MRYRAVFVAGLAIGYVLGTKAGRQRYDQIMRLGRRVADNPRVQEAAGLARAQAGELASTARRVAVDGFAERVPAARGLSGEPPGEEDDHTPV